MISSAESGFRVRVPTASRLIFRREALHRQDALGRDRRDCALRFAAA